MRKHIRWSVTTKGNHVATVRTSDVRLRVRIRPSELEKFRTTRGLPDAETALAALGRDLKKFGRRTPPERSTGLPI